jgi:orotidine-5'-phosphate decarboxylase
VVTFARSAQAEGIDGVVCSPLELENLGSVVEPGFLRVTPGIRPRGADKGDQARVATPALALRAGASHLVIGRPITRAEDPSAAAQAILNEIAEA